MILPPIVTEFIVISVAELVFKIGMVGSFIQLLRNNVPLKKDRRIIKSSVLAIPDLSIMFEILSLAINYRIYLITATLATYCIWQLLENGLIEQN